MRLGGCFPDAHLVAPVVALALLAASGCSSVTMSGVKIPDVDPQAAAAEAISLYDKNSDGQLNESELAACPAIQGNRRQYDGNSDGQISQDEIAARLKQIFAAGIGLLEVRCAVTRGGSPLSGANVKFVPEPFLADALQPAAATTGPDGTASVSIAAEQLPDTLRSAQVMQAGLYRVEIEHSSLSSGGKQPFGFEVDPARRGGNVARFNL
jgi:hypothetical protein